MSKKHRAANSGNVGPAPTRLAQAVQQSARFPQPVVTTHTVVSEQAWHGPLPHPDQLKAFDAVVPGAADRIIRMAEQEGEHTRALEAGAVREIARAQRYGQYAATFIATAAIIAAVWLALEGHDTVAGILGGTTLTTVVVAFLQARRAQADH